MNNKTRSYVINSVIDTGKRVEINVTKNGNRSFYGCEVCCTCKFFKRESQECILSYECARELDDKLSVKGKDYYSPVFIKKPVWFRCSWWEENER